MKFIDEYRDADAAKQIAEAIARHIIVTEGKKEAAPSMATPSASKPAFQSFYK